MKVPAALRLTAAILLGAAAGAQGTRSMRAPGDASHLLKTTDRLEASTRSSADALLMFLTNPAAEATLEGKAEGTNATVSTSTANTTMPPWNMYLPGCLAHVKNLVSALDRSYTDVQLETVLKQDCELEKEFPQSQEDGFEHQEACLQFAERLVKARDTELETGSVKGYEEFCQLYYIHKGGVIPGAEKQEEVEYEVPRLESKAKMGPLLTIIATVTLFTIVASWNAARKQPPH